MSRAAPRALAPSFRERRDDRHLLIWGELGQWLVVDEELLSLLEDLDGTRSLDRVLARQARRFGKPLAVVEEEAALVLETLERRGIVGESGPSPAKPKPEAVSIANITLNLTNRCNLRCPFCYNARRRSPELPVTQLMDAIEQGEPVLEDGSALILLGGEPFLDAERLFEALHRAAIIFGPKTMVSTNGTLLTAALAERLATLNVEVQVSIDSHDADRHDAARGPGSHAKALAEVTGLLRFGVHTIVSMVYDRRSYLDLEPYLDLALTMGVDEARLIPLRLIGGGLSNPEVAPDQHVVLEHLLEVLSRRPELRPLLGRDFFSIIAAICRTSAGRRSCGIGRRVVFVDADGKVYPCPNHVGPEHQCGDLATQDLADIVLGSPVLDSVRRRYDVTRYGRCRQCPLRSWCAGDCRGEVLALKGDIAGDSPHCDALLKVYPRLFWLIADGDPRIGVADVGDGGERLEDTFL